MNTEPVDQEHDECQCCGFEGEVRAYDTGPPTSEQRYFCDLCAGTMASRYYDTRQQPTNQQVLTGICYVANVILATLRTAK